MTAPCALYNEIDPFAAAWLRELIAAGHIAPGVVDERSIVDLRPADLAEFTQVHFFAGIGGWSYALRLAGWPDDEPVWTGSCPCQPFSAAGKRKGTADERHLWPVFGRLIGECKPAICFGEQVASRAGLQWLAGVRADLEALGYAVGAADLCAAGVGAPHIRQRLYWVADAENADRRREQQASGAGSGRPESGRSSGLGDPDSERCDGERVQLQQGQPRHSVVEAPRSSEGRGLGNANGAGRGEQCRSQPVRPQLGPAERAGGEGFWSNAIWLPCADGKARRIEPGLEPLAHGVPGRVGALRGYGNAIVPQVAAVFIRACREAAQESGAATVAVTAQESGVAA